jgi:hypothetical protein
MAAIIRARGVKKARRKVSLFSFLCPSTPMFPVRPGRLFPAFDIVYTISMQWSGGQRRRIRWGRQQYQASGEAPRAQEEFEELIAGDPVYLE